MNEGRRVPLATKQVCTVMQQHDNITRKHLCIAFFGKELIHHVLDQIIIPFITTVIVCVCMHAVPCVTQDSGVVQGSPPVAVSLIDVGSILQQELAGCKGVLIQTDYCVKLIILVLKKQNNVVPLVALCVKQSSVRG